MSGFGNKLSVTIYQQYIWQKKYSIDLYLVGFTGHERMYEGYIYKDLLGDN